MIAQHHIRSRAQRGPAGGDPRCHDPATTAPHRLYLTLAALAALILLGCFQPQLSDGDFSCGTSGQCPPGLQCDSSTNLCVNELGSSNPLGDAGPDRDDADVPGDGPITPELGGRVRGEQALYLFDEGQGEVVRDQASPRAATPLDLTVSAPDSAIWADGTLRLTSALAVLRTAPGQPDPSARLREALVASQAFTIEVWITPDEAVIDGPRRIVTLSLDDVNQSVVLGQGGNALGLPQNRYLMRLRTSDYNNQFGNPPLMTRIGVVETGLTHLVFTRAADGAVTCYIDGQAVELLADNGKGQNVPTDTRPGDLSVWPGDHTLGIGNEINGNRQWPGVLHLVAIYDRALSSDEIMNNLAAGADPERAE
ncbi:MAG: LamG domain-containing protein [Myxococcota bacterium]